MIFLKNPIADSKLPIAIGCRSRVKQGVIKTGVKNSALNVVTALDIYCIEGFFPAVKSVFDFFVEVEASLSALRFSAVPTAST